MILATEILTRENITQLTTCSICCQMRSSLNNLIILTLFGTKLPCLRFICLFGGCYVVDYQSRIICLRDEFFYPNSNICIGGCREENVNHSFMVCNHFRSIWSLVLQQLGICLACPNDLADYFIHTVELGGHSKNVRSFLQLIWLACVWVIWKKRICCIFQHKNSQTCQLINKVKFPFFLCG